MCDIKSTEGVCGRCELGGLACRYQVLCVSVDSRGSMKFRAVVLLMGVCFDRQFAAATLLLLSPADRSVYDTVFFNF